MLGSPSSSVDSSLLWALGGLCLAMISVALVRWVRERRVTARDLTREQRARLRDQEEVRRSMEELLTQLEEVADRINAQTGARFAELQDLIAAADQRIAQLQGAVDRPDNRDRPRCDDRPRARATAVPPPVSTPADHALSPALAEPPVVSAPVSAVAPPATARSERFRRIYELADSGSTSIAIADALRLPLGEVELVLSLRRYKAAAARTATKTDV